MKCECGMCQIIVRDIVLKQVNAQAGTSDAE
jgi:hypothetical protein